MCYNVRDINSANPRHNRRRVIKLFTQIRDNIYSIYVELPNSPLKNTNAYLIKAKDRNLLIDTGFPQEACRHALLAGLSELGVSMADTDIFLTHLHADHTGLAAELADENTKVYMSRQDYAAGLKFGQEEFKANKFRQQIAYGFSEEQIQTFSFGKSGKYKVDARSHDLIQLENGARLSYGGRELCAILTPGHTPGHMCLYDAADKVMFLGDHVLFDITPNIIAWDEMRDALGTYIGSLQAISAYAVDVPLPGHRGVFGTMTDRIDAIIEHHGRRVKELADALDLYPGSTVYQLAGHLNWSIRFNGDWECFPLEQKYFAVGETKAHIDYLVIRGRAACTYRDGICYYYPAENQSARL